MRVCRNSYAVVSAIRFPNPTGYDPPKFGWPTSILFAYRMRHFSNNNRMLLLVLFLASQPQPCLLCVCNSNSTPDDRSRAYHLVDSIASFRYCSHTACCTQILMFRGVLSLVKTHTSRKHGRTYTRTAAAVLDIISKVSIFIIVSKVFLPSIHRTSPCVLHAHLTYDSIICVKYQNCILRYID